MQFQQQEPLTLSRASPLLSGDARVEGSSYERCYSTRTVSKRLLAMRAYKRSQQVDGVQDLQVLEDVGLSVEQVEEMYRYLAIANYEDRFVIPTTHREYAENAFDLRGGCGFSFGNGCSDGASETSLFGGKKRRTIPIKATV